MAAGTPGAQDLRHIAGLTAGLTLASAQYKVVKFASTANAVIVVNASTDAAIGIVQNNPAAGEEALIAYQGIAIGIAGTSNLAAGNTVGYNTTARLVARTSANGRIGKALDASTAIGDYVRVMLNGAGNY